MGHSEAETAETHPFRDRRGRRRMILARVAGHGFEEFEVPGDATLSETMRETGRLTGVGLLPPGEHPFDRLHSIHGEQVGPVIEDLKETIDEYLEKSGVEPRFEVELQRTFRVNTRWDVAPSDQLSPREILALPKINLDYKEFTLYLPGKHEPLPLEVPILIERGADFEAQRDGRYGQGA
jgi:hypothetical protein